MLTLVRDGGGGGGGGSGIVVRVRGCNLVLALSPTVTFLLLGPLGQGIDVGEKRRLGNSAQSEKRFISDVWCGERKKKLSVIGIVGA